ncbi:type II toxin-antitoxin system ParD family antitoxin [Asticcacaulis sp.]|uniref:type II toxin-antitoxin system ParD family antitoxin n=1 Tax=Asticcacaulis sp. TaxID=1872648 RepID=UPI00260D1944|nr:type II toxin-antitoxin system ParD family antitoxin [Asticcacaulis sp.]
MPSSYSLGAHFENFIQTQLASGRYNNASEVLRDALRLMEDRERRLAAFDAAIQEGLRDAEAGRVHDIEDVFAELDAELAALENRQPHSG